MTRGSTSLANWDDPKKSAIALSSIVGALVLVKYVNIPSLVFYTLTLGLLIGSAAEFVGQSVLGTSVSAKYVKPHVSKLQLGPAVEYYAPHFVTIFKKLEGKFVDLLTIKDVQASFRAGLACYAGYLLFSWVSVWNIALVGTLVAFGFPPLYKSNKAVIDANVEKYTKLAQEKVDEGVKAAEKTLGPHVAKAKEVAAPLLKLVESKLPVRTAGTTVEGEGETVRGVAGVAGVAGSTGAAAHAGQAKKTAKAPTEPASEATEVDFNALGEQLKQQAEDAVAQSEPLYKAKLDTKAE